MASDEYWSEIFRIAGEDDAERLASALDSVPSLGRVRGKDGTSLVLFCVYRDRKRCLDVLTPRISEFTLHEAAATGHAILCTSLLAQAAWSIDTLSPDGWTALHLAGFLGYAEVVAALLDAGADPHVWARAFEQNLPLHAACAGGTRSTAAISLLARATSDVNVKQSGGYTPLMACAGNGNLRSLDELLSLGADPDARNDKGQTAHQIALAAGHAECAARLDRAAR